MRKEQKLLQAMSDIDDVFLLEAENTLAQQKQKRSPLVKWLVLVLAILGISASAYAAMQWHPVFLEYFKPSVTLIEKLEGNVQNVNAVSDCETLTLKISQTIGDESTVYLNLEVSLPDGKTWRDVLPKELTEGKEIVTLNPRYEFYRGKILYHDVKNLDETALDEFLKGRKFGPATGGGRYEEIVLDSSIVNYFIYYASHYDVFSEEPITLYISDFISTDQSNDSVLDGPFVISWQPENRGAQYTFEIDDADGAKGVVKISPLKLFVKLYRFEQMQEYDLTEKFSETIVIQYKDGTKEPISSLHHDLSGWYGDGYLEYTLRFRSLLDLDTIASIQIGPYLCKLK